MRVECPHCKYAAEMDPSRIPAGGTRVGCPKCKGRFLLNREALPAVPAEGPPAGAGAPSAVAPAEPVASAPPAEPVPPPEAPAPAGPAGGKGAKGGRELRKHKRVPFPVDVLVNRGSLMKAIDLSEGGLYVHTGRSFPPGSLIDVELPLGSGKVTVKGRVQHNQSGIGMGIQFVELSDAHLNAIREHMRLSLTEGRAAAAGRKKVVLIDEDAMKRRMSKSKLMLEGFAVADYEDPLEAARKLEEEAPDLVVLDLFMKRMDGFKLLAIIKQTPRWKDLPVVVYSSKGQDDVMQKVMDAGAAEFLLKMMTPPAKLAEIVKKALAVNRRP